MAAMPLITIITIMTDMALLRLMTWLSPAFPVGSYTYSHGLESAIEQGWIRDRASLADWLGDLLDHGGPRNDAIFIKAVFDGHDIAMLDEMACAFQATLELRAESTGQGRAFMRALRQVWPDPVFEANGERAYPLAVGLAARTAGIAPRATIQAYLNAFVANLVSAAVRAIPLGQTDGLVVLAAFEPVILASTERILSSTLDDLGGCAMMNDIASMLHETQHTRLFRS